MEFISKATNFSTEESKENDFIIKAAIRNFLFSLTLQAVTLNNKGAPLLGLAKSMYYRSLDKKN